MAAHNSTKLKLASAEADFKKAATNAETNARLHEDALRRLLSAEARVKKLEVELSQSFELAEVQLHAEKLAGNIVKEEYWKGEMAAIYRLCKAIDLVPRKEP